MPHSQLPENATRYCRALLERAHGRGWRRIEQRASNEAAPVVRDVKALCIVWLDGFMTR